MDSTRGFTVIAKNDFDDSITKTILSINKNFEVSGNKFTVYGDKFTFDGKDASIDFTFDGNDASIDLSEQKTSGNCYYSIFDGDDNSVHIEIAPNWEWKEADLWQLIDSLTEIACELNEKENEEQQPESLEGIAFQNNIVTHENLYEVISEFNANVQWLNERIEKLENREDNNGKSLLVVRTDSSLSDTTSEEIKAYVEKVLNSGNIDAEVLVLSDRMSAEFIKKW